MVADISILRSSQKAFFQSGKTRYLDFRIESLKKLEKTIIEHEPELLEALAADLGKPALEAYVAEVFFVISEIRLFCKKLKRWAKPQRAGNPFYFWPARSQIRREPFGCALVIAPWNYPVQLSLSPLIAAIAAGNCAILKPSEQAPATSAILAKIIGEAFDESHVAVVEGGKEVSQALLNEQFDFIFYTGSEQVGKIVAEAAASHLTPVILELGGKCPCVIGENCDIDLTASRIAAGKFFNAGQTCIAPDFVIAPEAIRTELVAKIHENVATFYAESPCDDFATIVNDDHYHRIEKLCADAEDAIKIGEDAPEKRRLAPRILPKASWADDSMSEEIFGPVLPVLSYSSEAELIGKLSELPSPLALYIFSRDKTFQETIAAAIQSGSIGINDVMRQATNLNLPFGGVGKSGMGRYRGKFGFEAFTYARAVTKRYFLKDLFAIHPPYSGKLDFLRKFLK